MDTSKLTANQLKVYNCVKSYITEMHIPPTVRDICAGTGIKSTSTVHGALKYLSNEGFLSYAAGARRAITLCACEPVEVTDDGILHIPLLGNVAAGQPILAVDNIQEYYNLPKNLVHSTQEGNTFMLKVQGESMIEIGMYDGDMIIVSQTESVSNGDIAVVRIDDSVTVKRIYVEKDRVVLKPENSSMQPIYADPESVDLVGKVVGLIRNY